VPQQHGDNQGPGKYQGMAYTHQNATICMVLKKCGFDDGRKRYEPENKGNVFYKECSCNIHANSPNTVILLKQ